MEKNFTIKIEGFSDQELSGADAGKLDLIPAGKQTYHILSGKKAFRAQLTGKDFQKKTYRIKVNSNTYHIRINDELDRLIEKMGLSSRNTKKTNQIKAPMPGVILDLKVGKGDTVQEGDTLLILEAMKMENAILCPKDAVIKNIHVALNETVEKNKLLIELE